MIGGVMSSGKTVGCKPIAKAKGVRFTPPPPRVERAVTSIMCKMKGWDRRGMLSDKSDHPGEHAYERHWLRTKLLDLISKSGEVEP